MEIVPIFGMLTGIVITTATIWGFVKFMQGPVGIALGRRIQGHHGSEDSEIQAEVAYLREQMDRLEHQVNETQERLDFTERLLSQGGRPEQFPEGR